MGRSQAIGVFVSALLLQGCVDRTQEYPDNFGPLSSSRDDACIDISGAYVSDYSLIGIIYIAENGRPKGYFNVPFKHRARFQMAEDSIEFEFLHEDTILYTGNLKKGKNFICTSKMIKIEYRSDFEVGPYGSFAFSSENYYLGKTTKGELVGKHATSETAFVFLPTPVGKRKSKWMRWLPVEENLIQ